jgi:DNA-directed RNA polymerase subunit RPC12/RpoP
MNTNDSGAITILGLPLMVIIVIWLGTAIIAAGVAPDRRTTFFVLTLFLFGPLGIALALIANPRTPPPITYVEWAPRPLAAGRTRHYCPRCGADIDLLPSATEFDCWRCGAKVKADETQPPPRTPPASPSLFSKDYWEARFPGLDFRPPWETGPR